VTVHRYKDVQLVASNQDPLIDMLTFLSFLRARDFTIDILVGRHGLSSADAKSRTKLIVPHVQVASNYLEQGAAGHADISFLSLYYGILNLLKVYVLIGPHHASLPSNRWHGATYNGMEKDSHSIATEIITIKKGGVIPLFYKTIVGKALTTSELEIRIGDVLPFVSGVTHEYALATNQESGLIGGRFDTTNLGTGDIHRFSLGDIYQNAIPIRSLKALRGFTTAKSPLVNVFYGPAVASTADIRSTINCRLLYDLQSDLSFVPACNKRVELFEELPIALLFFYLSNICRYKPEFLDKLQESRYWPLLVSCRTHALHAFLRCFWSFINQKSIFIQAA